MSISMQLWQIVVYIDEAPVRFLDIMMTIYNRCCPVKTRTVSYKDRIKPWISLEIKGYMRKRQNYLVPYRSGRMTRAVYNRYRNFVTNRIKIARRNYFESKFNGYRSNVRSTWRTINDIIRPRAVSANTTIRSLIVNGVAIVGEADVANEFNQFFSSVGANIANSLPPAPRDFNSYLPGNYPSNFTFSDVSSGQVCNMISGLKNKSCDISCFPTRALKCVSRIVAPGRQSG